MQTFISREAEVGKYLAQVKCFSYKRYYLIGLCNLPVPLAVVYQVL
jgi:hypothetical protein